MKRYRRGRQGPQQCLGTRQLVRVAAGAQHPQDPVTIQGVDRGLAAPAQERLGFHLKGGEDVGGVVAVSHDCHSGPRSVAGLVASKWSRSETGTAQT